MSALRHRFIWEKPNNVIFLGAGVSADSGLPLGDEGADQIIRVMADAVGLDPDRTKLKRLRFEVVLDCMSQYISGAVQSIVSTFEDIGRSPVHQALARCSNSGWFWLETNFDNHPEKARNLAFGPDKRFTIIRDMNEISRVPRNAKQSPILLKLHGDANVVVRDHIKATMREVLRLLPEGTIHEIVTRTKRRPLIVAGYTARDPDLTALLNMMIKHAESVTWIDLPKWRDLTNRHPHLRSIRGAAGARWTYISGGIGNTLGVPHRVHEISPEWIGRIEKCVGAFPIERVMLALSEMCLSVQDYATVDKISDHLRYGEGYNLEALHIVLRSLCDRGRHGDVKQVINFHKNSHVACQVNSSKLGVATVYARAYQRIGANAMAVECLEDAMRDNGDQQSVVERAYAMARLGYCQIRANMTHSKWKRTMEEAVFLAQSSGDPIVEADVRQINATGLVYIGGRECVATALQEMKYVVATESHIGIPERLAVAKGNYAEALRQNGRPREAFELYKEIKESADLVGDEETVMRALNGMALAQILFEENPLGAADPTLIELIERIERNRNATFGMLGIAASNRGYLRICCGRNADAIPFLDDAVGLSLESGHVLVAGYSLCLKGWAELASGAVVRSEETRDRVIRENLRPVTEEGVEFSCLDFALSSRQALEEGVLLSKTVETFKEYPEQRFRLLALMFDACGGRVSAGVLQEIADHALKAANDAGVQVFRRRANEMKEVASRGRDA